MGGCLDKPKVKKPKVMPATLKSPDSKIAPSRLSIQEEQRQPEQPKPKHKRMTTNELLTTYSIENTLELSSKIEGPKYLANIVDGSSRVLRVVSLDEVNEKRLQTYKKLIGFETYENQEGSIMIVDEYCAGPDLYELVEARRTQEPAAAAKSAVQVFTQVAQAVAEFHRLKVWLGNLTLSSFRRRSAFGEEVRLVDFNLTGPVGEHEKMGFAHRDSLEADCEFLGFLLQLLLCDQPPIFIPHKLQYVDFESLPSSNLIQKLLKGNPLTPDELASIKPEPPNTAKVALGYKLRRDINKLLKMRRKRHAHSKCFYGEDTRGIITEGRLQEEAVYRLETERIFSRIQTYIEDVRSTHEESFINYAGNNDSLRKLKEVFLLTDREKKMGELRECLSTIK